MAIVPLCKVTIYGTTDQKSDVLDGLQSLGCLHLIGLREVPDGNLEVVSKEAREALRYLHSCATIRRKSLSRSLYDRQRVIRETLDVKRESESLESEQDHLETAIEDMLAWGEFYRFEIESNCGQQLWFYKIPLHEMSVLTDALVWHVAGKDNRFAYVVVVAEVQPTGIPYQPANLDQRPLSQLRSRLDAVEERLDDLHWQRVSQTRWSRLLQDDLDAADDAVARLAAAQGTIDDDRVFAIQGYIPETASTALHRYAADHGLAVVQQPVGRDEAAPTLLRNPEQVAGAEGCVTFYITPAYHAWDPTPVVFFSFSLFFAMIVADAGYGLVMAFALALGWRHLGRAATTYRIRNLFAGIVVATILYGVLVGSYFGIEPPLDSLLNRLRIRIGGQPMMENQTAMMAISVGIGVTHLVLANLISAWNSRYRSRSLGHLGWAMVMIGMSLIGIGVLSEVSTLESAGKLLTACGAVIILLFSSSRPWELGWRANGRRLLDGVMQFANLSKAFGDVLSYLRLFALGLASAQLAITFNGLAADASGSGGVGLLAALLILIVGHSINFLLGLLGGVVHGLRLNCIEFFNWSLTEEGYTFQPFRKKAGN